MNLEWKDWVMGIETVMIGFFIRAYFVEWLQLKKNVRELLTDKALRDNENTQKP